VTDNPELVHVGWWCWRCEGLVEQPCRSDSVPVSVPAEWAVDMEAEIRRLGDEDDAPTDQPGARFGPGEGVHGQDPYYAATDQAALRDRIADALRTTPSAIGAENPQLGFPSHHQPGESGYLGWCALCVRDIDALAAAVLAVLTAPVDRATVLEAERDSLGREADRLREDWVEMRTRAERAESERDAYGEQLDEAAETIAARTVEINRLTEELRRVAAESAPATGHDDSETGDCCGALPPDLFIDEAGREWHAGDCWCTLAPGHSDQHRCQPCTDRVGAPGWTDGPPAAAQQPKEA